MQPKKQWIPKKRSVPPGGITTNGSAILNHNGLILLLNKRSNAVLWAHDTHQTPYRRYIAQGVLNYIDFDPQSQLLHHHSGESGSTPKAISLETKEDNLEKRKELLTGELEKIYPVGRIMVECTCSNLVLDYQSGINSTDKTTGKFKVRRHNYKITYLSSEPETVRWELEFFKIEAALPMLSCPCMVYQSISLSQFIDLCHSLDITGLPGGILVKDLEWIKRYETNKINFNYGQWIDNKMKCLYEDKPAEVIRFQKEGNALHNIRRLRVLPSASGMVQFLGWHEDKEYYYVASEQCKRDFEHYVREEIVPNQQRPLPLGVLRDLAIHVYHLHTIGIIHGNLDPKTVFVRFGNEVKLGLPAFMTQGHRECDIKTDLDCLGKLMLVYGSYGAYKFDREGRVETEQLDMCKSPELRHLINLLTGDSLPATIKELLAHPWLWDSHKIMAFINTYCEWLDSNRFSSHTRCVEKAFTRSGRVFKGRWNAELDVDFVNERIEAGRAYVAKVQQQQSQQQLPPQQLPPQQLPPQQHDPYDFKNGCSLIKFHRNALIHHGRIRKDIQRKLAPTKEVMLKYLQDKFPNFLMTLYSIGKTLESRRQPALDLHYYLVPFYR